MLTLKTTHQFFWIKISETFQKCVIEISKMQSYFYPANIVFKVITLLMQFYVYLILIFSLHYLRIVHEKSTTSNMFQRCIC